MPRKIGFSVVEASSEDGKYRLIELNSHGPTVKGWQSEVNCNYPQDIILQLEEKCVLNKIQILAHQFMIPSRVEFYCSNDDINSMSDLKSIGWEYIGYVTLTSNESTYFKSRELKSAEVPKISSSLIKLTLCKNYENALNVHNQVSIIAVNIIGSGVDMKVNINEELLDDVQITKLNEVINNPEYVSPFDDLAFEMYVAPDVAKIIRDMEIKKYLAVISERFEYARKLKNAISKLRPDGEKLAKYELEKRHAVELEDYEKARLKKNQMEQFKNELFTQLHVEELLEANGICARNDECIDITPSNKKLLSPTVSKVDRRSSSPSQVQGYSVYTPRHQSPKTGSPGIGSPIINRGSLRRRNKSAGAIAKSTYEMYEEKPLPTLRHSQTNEFLRECQVEPEHKNISKLNEREKKQASLPILVFGAEMVEKFYSKHYSDKEEGLIRLKEELLDYDNSKLHTANKVARAAIFLLHRALRDKVFTIYNLASEVIRLFFVQFVPGRVLSAEVSRSVDKVLPELLTKSGDTSSRIHHMAVHTILTMADVTSVRELHIIPVHLSRPVSSSTHPRLALSRAEMVEQLILSHGISTDKQSGLTCRTLTEFGASGLHHPAETVRKVSERILVLVYKVNPRMVRKQLPPDDDITRRNLLYRQLFDTFDTIDMQNKSEVTETERFIQQYSLGTNEVCFNQESNGFRNEISKCISTGNIDQFAENAIGNDSPAILNYTLSKSQSGGNIVQINANHIQHTHKQPDLQRSSSANVTSSPTDNSQKTYFERHCIFCNQSEKVILLTSNSMNSHYWRHCPMLMRCKYCSQVVEVATLTEHLIMECEKNEMFMQCSQCSEAVSKSKLPLHLAQCHVLPEGYKRCPLCHTNLENSEFCWKNHFMGLNVCTTNTRLKSLNQKQVKIHI